ncbi:MAG: radical SAM protein, partial [Rhodospirillum sp.]|nr:radical SAM protein [Rhodospirillum sp.]
MDNQDHRIKTIPQGDEGFGLYIHWPFCLSKCPYCDFNSHVVDTIDHGVWSQALIKDLETQSARLTGQGRILTSIFLGGGTPSLMAPNTVAALIDRAADLWPTAPDLEITLEANPGTVDRDRFRDFKLAGVNRLSLGIQSLDDRALQSLGRVLDAKAALAALDTARSLSDRFSFDLIYAR